MKIRGTFAYILFIIASIFFVFFSILAVILLAAIKYSKQPPYYGFIFGALMGGIVGIVALLYWFIFYYKITKTEIRQKSFDKSKTIKKENILAIYKIRTIESDSSKLASRGRWIVVFEKNPDFPDDDPNNLDLIKWTLFYDQCRIIRFYSINIEKTIKILNEYGYDVKDYPGILSCE